MLHAGYKVPSTRRPWSSSLPPQSIKHRNIDPPVDVAFLEFDSVGLVEEIGIENDRTVGPVGNRHGSGAALGDEIADPLVGPRTVVLPKGPVEWRGLVPDNETAAVRIEIGLIRYDPEVH